MGILELLAGIAAATGLVAGGAAWHRADRRRRVTARRDVAVACGLTDVALGPAGGLTGRKGRLEVAMRPYRDQSRIGEGTRIVIGGLLPGLRLAQPGIGARLWRALGERDLEVGDPGFDSAALLHGPALEVRALFDATTRAAARTALEAFASLTVERGQLTADSDEATGGARPRLVAADLEILLDLARRLRPPETPQSRLAQIAHADPLATVRAQALATLTESEPRHPETRTALRAALTDASPALRLQAARELGDEGASTLLALADDFAAGDALSAEALAALGDRFTVEQARRILQRAAVTDRAACARAALAVVARGGAAEVAAIADVLARSSEPIRAAAAAALGTIAAPSAIAPLRSALRAQSFVVAAAAARALGSCGSADEVEPLREVEARGGDVGRAAREAVAAIQSRLSGATPGQVSLAGGDAGRVSVVDSPGGRVSLDGDA
ncbi:MAG: HEAT repeat domain-containing protein [Vicinamibacteria bacterium]